MATEVDGEQDEPAGDSAMTTQVDVESSTGVDVPPFLVATLTGEDVTAALLARSAGDTHQIVFGPEVPRFFMAFLRRRRRTRSTGRCCGHRRAW